MNCRSKAEQIKEIRLNRRNGCCEIRPAQPNKSYATRSEIPGGHSEKVRLATSDFPRSFGVLGNRKLTRVQTQTATYQSRLPTRGSFAKQGSRSTCPGRKDRLMHQTSLTAALLPLHRLNP